MKSLSKIKNKLLQELPSSLRAEVVNYIHADIIKNIAFFKDKTADFLYASLPLVRRFNLPAKEILYKEGEPAEEVYFILKGQMKLLTKDKITFMTYKEGSMFGENDVVYKEPRDSTAQSVNECQLLVLSRFDFKKLMEEFPEDNRKIKINSLLRRERHKKEKQKASDKIKNQNGKKGRKSNKNKRKNLKENIQSKSAPKNKQKMKSLDDSIGTESNPSSDGKASDALDKQIQRGTIKDNM